MECKAPLCEVPRVRACCLRSKSMLYSIEVHGETHSRYNPCMLDFC